MAFSPYRFVLKPSVCYFTFKFVCFLKQTHTFKMYGLSLLAETECLIRDVRKSFYGVFIINHENINLWVFFIHIHFPCVSFL